LTSACTQSPHALFSQTVATAAINQPPTALQLKAERFAANTEKRQNIEWSFELFQNGRCTGESDPYSGIGTTACRNGILNGGALASIKKLMDPDCTVLFFSDPNCTPANVIDDIDESTPTNCRHPQQGGQIQSWGVHYH
jgi:hypothetical protein